MTETTKKKYVAKELYDNYHLPNDDQDIVQVIRSCGNNLHEVITSQGEKYLVSMPTKFRRFVWIKRGDYLIVTPIEEGNKVRAEIHSILLKDHIRYIKEHNKWPKAFDTDCSKEATAAKEQEKSALYYDYDCDLLVPNMNRINNQVLVDEDSESD